MQYFSKMCIRDSLRGADAVCEKSAGRVLSGDVGSDLSRPERIQCATCLSSLKVGQIYFWTFQHMFSITFLMVKSSLLNGKLRVFQLPQKRQQKDSPSIKYKGISATNSISRLYTKFFKARIENQYEDLGFVQANIVQITPSH